MTTKKIAASLFATVFGLTAVFAQSTDNTSVTPVSKEESEKAFAIAEEAQDLLAYNGDYSATVTLVVEKPSKPKENMQFKIFERVGKDLMTMVQLFPDADKGQGWLRDGDNIWSYDPVSRKFNHSSLKEALGDSDMKVDDMSNDKQKWRKNYEVTGFKDGMLGKYEVHIITVHAITPEPSYAYTTYYIRKDVKLPLKMENFSTTNRLMRTILMPKYAKVSQGYVATQTLVRDELNKGEQTQQIISDLTFDSLPDTIFTKAYLEGLN